MLKKFLETIEKNQLVEKKQGVVLGISGGPDSVTMLHLFWRIREDYQLRLYAVHLNHQFRGEAADQDAVYVEELCRRFGIPCYCFREDIQAYSKEKGISFEEGGRERRYQLFEKVLTTNQAQRIAVAQNLDDQAETVLMRLMRGAGIEGLGAMDYKRGEHIIRPLLNISRKEIEDYCQKYQLQPRIDQTNFQSIYTRNRIRLELIPYIEKYFNPGIKETLSRTAKLMREDTDFILSASKGLYKQIALKAGDEIHILTGPLQDNHPALQKRVLREAILQLDGTIKNIGAVHVEQLIELMDQGKSGSTLDLPNEINVLRDYGKLCFRRKKNHKNKDLFEYPLKIGENIEIEKLNMVFLAEELPRGFKDSLKGGSMVQYFDLDKVHGDMIVRNRKEGDKFAPLGIRGTKKLKEFMIDEKVSREKRDQIPLICDQGGIMWVVGYRMSERYKVDKDTKRVLRISCCPKY
ncbi:tRNA(Ile)-lysidine synthase [Geosporobacter subterraneus DSM 17957]|uniref:tRNA(Ile)-lysidine synthase n=1 Tax=Geosporobacter subterraneus DSM 17957 TaxID=1121919 RepID=A0A1M6FEG5_9FIRM|nr:tRNA lysidine(34) synthetase TilS [Geosporobacter subterraneus]SHI96087.1 tRNA(Ile)-lysidine synthase [Geosporobacter subterraneus DSM 17957]